MNSALVINDDLIISDRIAQMLEDLGWEVYTADTELAAKRVCESFLPELVISDVEMCGGVGYEAISLVRRVSRTAYIVAVTRGSYDYKLERVAEICGADKLVAGPVSAQKIHAALLDGRNNSLLDRLQ